MGSTAANLKARLADLQAGIETGAALRAVEQAGGAAPAEAEAAGRELTAGRVEGLVGRLAEAAGKALLVADRVPQPQVRLGELNAAAKLANAAAGLAHALTRLRGQGTTQVVRVEKVVVEPGARAVVGAVAQRGRGAPLPPAEGEGGGN